MSPLEQIDQVLLSLDPKESIPVKNISNRLKEKKIELHPVRQIEIINKLLRDGYLRIEKTEEPKLGVEMESISYYVLTFEGECFQEMGGYSGEKAFSSERGKWVDSLMLSNDLNQKRLNKVTAYLTIGTFSLVLFEIVKFCLEHFYFPSCPCP